MNSLCVSGSHARLHQRDFIEVINILYQADYKEKTSTSCPKEHVHSKPEKALPRHVRRITLKHSFRSDNDVTVKNNLAGSQEKRVARWEDENEAAADEFKLNRKRSQSLPPVKKINNFNKKVNPMKPVSTDDDVTNAGFVTSAVEWRKKMVEYQEEILRLRRRVRQQDDVIERNRQQECKRLSVRRSFSETFNEHRSTTLRLQRLRHGERLTHRNRVFQLVSNRCPQTGAG